MKRYQNCDLFWVIDISKYRQLFVDNMVIARMENCVKSLHSFEKIDNKPIIFPEYDWEKYGCQGQVIYDKADELFKCWYLTHCLNQGDDFAIPGICYAESKDGIDWHKPKLGLFDWKGSDTNFVYMANPNMVEVFGGVITRENEQEDEYRYRAMMFRCGAPDEYTEKVYGYYTAHSADGIKWKVSSEPAISKVRDDPEMSDAFSFMYDTLRDRYICFVKKHRLCPDGIGDQGFIKRIRGISFSKDFIHWSKPETMLVPDDADEPDVNLYNVGGFVYEGQYLGFLEIYHSGLEGRKARITDLQLISSRDGQTWWRAGGRKTILPIGRGGDWDRGGVYTWGNQIIYGPDGKLWYYYIGASYHHLPIELGYFPSDKKFRGIGLAKLRIDGFVSIDADDKEGFVLTKRLKFKGSKLHINADVRQNGYIKVEVFNVKHQTLHPLEEPLGAELDKVIPEFALDNCIGINDDSVDAIVRWKGNPSLSKYESKLVAIKFYLKNASLYSFWID